MRKLLKRLLIALTILIVLLGGSWWAWRKWWSGEMLYLAVVDGNAPRVKTLLRFGADPNSENKSGYSLLRISFEGRVPYGSMISNPVPRLVVMRHLLEHGADPNDPPSKASALLERAVRHRLPEAVELLLSHGAQFESDPHLGWSRPPGTALSSFRPRRWVSEEDPTEGQCFRSPITDWDVDRVLQMSAIRHLQKFAKGTWESCFQ